MQNLTPGPANRGEPLPDFQPVDRKYRHDGWTPQRQRAFIAALADTGSVSRAAALVNMSSGGAYYLRRQAGAESFRRAWEAALDFGVQRLKDLAFERAIEGELVPVMSFGKLVGYRRKTNDRLLMFCLRMNARAPDGRRYGQTYMDPAAERLSGTISPLPSGEKEGGAKRRKGEGCARPAQPLSATAPLRPTEAEHTDDQAHLIRHFDPVDLTLDQIEALQALLAEAATTRRALEHQPERDPQNAFLSVAEVPYLLETGITRDETGAYHQPDGELPWRKLDPQGLEEQGEIDRVLETMREEMAAAKREAEMPKPREAKTSARPVRKRRAK